MSGNAAKTPRSARSHHLPEAATASAVVVVAASALAEIVRAAVAEALAELSPRSEAPALLDRRALASALGCGVDTVDRLRREGCPELTVGDVPRFELDRVLGWLRGRKQ